MPKLRRQSGREIVAGLQSLGFDIVSTKGSHAKLQRVTAAGKQTLTIPLHDDLAAGTLQAIYRQALRYVAEDSLRPIFYLD